MGGFFLAILYKNNYNKIQTRTNKNIRAVKNDVHGRETDGYC